MKTQVCCAVTNKTCLLAFIGMVENTMETNIGVYVGYNLLQALVLWVPLLII